MGQPSSGSPKREDLVHIVFGWKGVAFSLSLEDSSVSLAFPPETPTIGLVLSYPALAFGEQRAQARHEWLVDLDSVGLVCDKREKSDENEQRALRKLLNRVSRSLHHSLDGNDG